MSPSKKCKQGHLLKEISKTLVAHLQLITWGCFQFLKDRVQPPFRATPRCGKKTRFTRLPQKNSTYRTLEFGCTTVFSCFFLSEIRVSWHLKALPIWSTGSVSRFPVPLCMGTGKLCAWHQFTWMVELMATSCEGSPKASKSIARYLVEIPSYPIHPINHLFWCLFYPLVMTNIAIENGPNRNRWFI